MRLGGLMAESEQEILLRGVVTIPEVRRDINPYFRLFLGESVLLSEMVEKTPMMRETINALVRSDKVSGQFTLEGDCLYSMRLRRLDIPVFSTQGIIRSFHI